MLPDPDANLPVPGVTAGFVEVYVGPGKNINPTEQAVSE
ncbi:hypothetical protein MGAST_00420 [Mycobacterium gastri 'Wayne']|nr:hypothetical protein MGAST_00420 [Mycobacterium gastri 'Wayne']